MKTMTFSEALKVLEGSEQLFVYRLGLGGMIGRYGHELAFIDVEGKTHPVSEGVSALDEQATDWRIACVDE